MPGAANLLRSFALLSQRRTSSTLNAVTRSDSLTGEQNSPDLIFRHRVAEDHGRMGGVPGRGRFGPFPRLLFAAACSGVTVDSPISCDRLM